MDEKLKVYEEKMDKAISVLRSEYAAIRAGRANPHVLDQITVGLLRSAQRDPAGGQCVCAGAQDAADPALGKRA